MGKVLVFFILVITIACSPESPQVPSEFQCDTQVIYSSSDEKLQLPLAVWENGFESTSTISGKLNWNYNIKRSLFTVTQIGHFPIKPREILRAYDIDNIFTYDNDNCVTSPTGLPMGIYFQWANPNTEFPSHRVQYVNNTVISLPDGSQSQCDLWYYLFVGLCGPTQPPPCGVEFYLCVTSEDLPVMSMLNNLEEGFSLQQLYWNVNVVDQANDTFAIPENCTVYDYPPDPPYGLVDGFENGEVALFWIPCGEEYHRWECGHIFAQSIIVRSGSFAANITIQPGDISQVSLIYFFG
jgi:hypothetical protein